jgi:hypothetical protein
MPYRLAPRPLLLTGLLALAATCANAQPAPTSLERKPAVEKKTEVITHEDKGSRIEELRVGGETRRIDVETKSGVPAYQIQPPDAGANTDSKGSVNRSSWRVLKF